MLLDECKWRPLPGTTAPAQVLPGVSELCSSLGMSVPSVDAALRLGVAERHLGPLQAMLLGLTNTAAVAAADAAADTTAKAADTAAAAAKAAATAAKAADAPEERRAARLAAALLAPGAVDSILLSLLSCKEARNLGPALRRMWADISNAYVPCAVPGGELGAQSTTEWLTTSAATLMAERCTAACMRAFFKTAAWEHLVNTPGLLAGRSSPAIRPSLKPRSSTWRSSAPRPPAKRRVHFSAFSSGDTKVVVPARRSRGRSPSSIGTHLSRTRRRRRGWSVSPC